MDSGNDGMATTDTGTDGANGDSGDANAWDPSRCKVFRSGLVADDAIPD